MFVKILKLSLKYKVSVFFGILFSGLYVITHSAALWTVASLLGTVFENADSSTVESLQIGGSINDQLKNLVLKFIDADSPMERLTRLTLLITILFFLKNLFAYLKGISFAVMELSLIHDMRVRLYAAITRQTMSFLDNHKRGEFISIIVNDVLALRRSVKVMFTNMLTEPLNVLAIVILLFIISWKFTLYVFIMFPVSAFIFWIVGASMRRKGRRSFRQMAVITDFLHQMFDGIRLIKAVGKEEKEINNFSGKSRHYSNLQLGQQKLAIMSPAVGEMVGVITGSILFIVGGKMVLVDGLMDSEDFLRYIILLFSAFHPIKLITSVNVSLQNGFAAGERVFGLLEFPVQRLENKSSSVLNKFKEQIRFENIRFKYEKEENNWVLDDVSFAIKKGQTVALVGASGSGKSTLADLLLRFYLPDQGTVSIDGKNIQDIKSESLRKMIGVVSQDVFLLNNSIKLNIAYGDENASDDKIYKAAEIANARDFIEQFEKGWDTVVGDRGVKLSGGQKQRLSIARAVLQDQEILILDEATSSLDNESERLVQESLNLLMEGRTSLIIAHRLSTIRNADKIFVLNKGKIIDSGTHEELLAESAYYQNLYQQQNDSSLES